MTSDEIRKLAGAYATGSLTDAEKKALFEAALEDQDLFDELAREQALKEAIEEPGVRDRLIARLSAPAGHSSDAAAPEPSHVSAWRKNLAWGLAAAFVMAMSVTAVVIMRSSLSSQTQKTVTQAQVEHGSAPDSGASSLPAAPAQPGGNAAGQSNARLNPPALPMPLLPQPAPKSKSAPNPSRPAAPSGSVAPPVSVAPAVGPRGSSSAQPRSESSPSKEPSNSLEKTETKSDTSRAQNGAAPSASAPVATSAPPPAVRASIAPPPPLPVPTVPSPATAPKDLPVNGRQAQAAEIAKSQDELSRSKDKKQAQPAAPAPVATADGRASAVSANAPPAPAQRIGQLGAAAGRGGAGGGGGAGTSSDAPRISRFGAIGGLVAPKAKTAPRPARNPARFALDYTVANDVLTLKFAVEGYISIHFTPGGTTVVQTHVAAGSTRRDLIPDNCTEIYLLFTTGPQTDTGGVEITREPKDAYSGSAVDPSGKRIDLMLRLY